MAHLAGASAPHMLSIVTLTGSRWPHDFLLLILHLLSLPPLSVIFLVSVLLVVRWPHNVCFSVFFTIIVLFHRHLLFFEEVSNPVLFTSVLRPGRILLGLLLLLALL